MPKRAFISFELDSAKILIGDKYYEALPDEIFRILKANKVKEIDVSVFIENISLFNFSLPIKIPPKKQKDRRFLSAMVKNEIKKRFQDFQDFSFTYEVEITETGTQFFCTIFNHKDIYKIIDYFIPTGCIIRALYPSIEILTKVADEIEKKANNFVLLFFEGNKRHYLIAKNRQVIFYRAVEGESSNITDEDIAQINMTNAYAIQNLRIQPEVVFILGTKETRLEGLNLDYQFLEIKGVESDYLIPFLLKKFEKDLKIKNILPEDYKKSYSKLKFLTRAAMLLSGFLTSGLVFLGFLITATIDEKADIDYKSKEIQMLYKQNDRLVNEYMSLYNQLKPYVELINKKYSIPDSRHLLAYSSVFSDKKNIEIKKIECKIEANPILKITGFVNVENLTDRERIFDEIKTEIIKELSILKESWDVKKGEFTLEIGKK
ncbi:hypothetical protein [Thermodesulfovibrio hydrogeniphilus]